MSEIAADGLKYDKKKFIPDGISRIYDAKWGDCDVILKVTRVENEQKKRIRDEAECVIDLEQPNVILSWGTTKIGNNEHFGMVLEKAEHDSLEKWIGKIDNKTSAKIALGIVDGLEYVHSHMVIHHDIRPQNILRFGPEDDMIAKIDFSTCNVLKWECDLSFPFLGDDFYNAPEVMYCNVMYFAKYDFKVDIFSLAITLFELFYGKLVKDLPKEVRQSTLSATTGSVAKIPSDFPIPACLRSVIQRGWALKPEKRSTHAAFKLALEEVMRT